MRLEDLGWDDSWRRALPRADARPHGSTWSGSAAGRVVRVDRGICQVVTASGPVQATLGGNVLDALARDAAAGPCTGDWCAVTHWPDGPVTVEELAPRRTAVQRADASRSSRLQVLAANVDLVAIVVALHPEPNIGRIERLLTIAWESGADPVVVLTKSDLVVDAEAVAEDVQAAAGEVAVIVCSSATGVGVAQVRDLLAPGRTMALVGASGHGKSSLANALVGAHVLRTRAIRQDGKGRHTTVRRELVLLPGGGALIDTPGLRGVGVHRDDGALAVAFPDVDELSDECRFRDCRHLAEPGCAVLAALESGQLSVRRWESWRRLNRDAERAEARSAARLRNEQAKVVRGIKHGKVIRPHGWH